MIHKKYILIIPLVSILGVGILFAADTIIQNILGGQVTDGPNSYPDQVVRTIEDGDLKFINKGNNSNRTGDYLGGYYYDSAYGTFRTDAVAGHEVRVSPSDAAANDCVSDYDGYKLEGYSYNPEFGFMNFQTDSTHYAYICFPEDSDDKDKTSYIGGYAYSPLIGFQNFDGIAFDTSVDFTQDYISDGYVKIDGIASSSNSSEALSGQFDGDVRVLGKINKGKLRQQIQRDVYSVIKLFSNATSSSAPSNPISLSGDQWTTAGTGGGKIINGNKVLLFSNIDVGNVKLLQENNLTGNKTLVVEGGNIYITGNIRGDGMLGLIALKGSDGTGGNIYINPAVTDIHAILYADKSVISYNGGELDGDTNDTQLANQLYIYGSVFSENTLGGGIAPYKCPFYVNSVCDKATAMKYDFNFLRRYILVQPTTPDGYPDGGQVPYNGGKESYMGDNDYNNNETQKPGYRKYPLIIEYNPKIQQDPPVFF